jgi:hypothetical protein
LSRRTPFAVIASDRNRLQLDQLPHLVVAEIDGDPDAAINLPPHPGQLMLPIMEKGQDS